MRLRRDHDQKDVRSHNDVSQIKPFSFCDNLRYCTDRRCSKDMGAIKESSERQGEQAVWLKMRHM
jgi:hypothetical protein